MNIQSQRLSTFVMAGGKGERLYPLTKDRTKPAVSFGGSYRIIDFTLSNCINSGIRRINVLTQYKSNSLAYHLKMGWSVFHPELQEYIDVIPAQKRVGEYWYRGTADAIHQNQCIIARENPDYILILAGDHIYKMDYSKMLAFHIEKKADVTVGVVETDKKDSEQFGVVEVDKNRKIIGFKEKPNEPKTIPGKADRIYASMGIYIFSKKPLLEALNNDAHSESEHDFGNNILPQMLTTRRMSAYGFQDENQGEEPYWRDIGTLDAYYQANMDLLSVRPTFNLYDQHWPIRSYQPPLPPAKLLFADRGKHARRGEALDSLICSGCIISGGRVIRSILSPQVRINSYSNVKGSVLLDGVEVGRGAMIRKAIIDKHVKIPPGMTIGYDIEEDRKQFTVTESGMVVIYKDMTIAPARDRPRKRNITVSQARPSLPNSDDLSQHMQI